MLWRQLPALWILLHGQLAQQALLFGTLKTLPWMLMVGALLSSENGNTLL